MNPEKQIIRTITLRLIPFLILLYMVAFIDRSAVGFAKLHMAADLGISDIAYGFGAGLFFIGYFIFEVPSNLMLERFGARRWFARILITWGAITACMALLQGPYSFYAMRFLLGAAEAGFFPGVLYYITRWYPVRHRGKVLGLFILAQPIALMITGPLAGALLGMDGTLDMHGWQWLMLTIGLPAMLLAWPTLRILPDTPAQARWLSEEDRTWLNKELEADRQEYGQTEHSNPLHALKDRRVLLLALLYLPVTLSNYGLSLWLPTLVHQFGGSNLVTGFVSAVPYVFGIIGLLIVPRSSDRLNDRYGHLCALYFLGALGMFLSAWATLPAMQLMALSLTAFTIFSGTAIFWTLPGRFLTGAGAAAGIALINSIGNLGGYLGPFGIGALKEYTGSLAAGLYFVSAVEIFGVLLTVLIYFKLERKMIHQQSTRLAEQG
ncbi:Sugar phosphate permease [Azotobacter beijerinckii]|uniref:Sugar phosphate permease n=2 Tax=Azotobacter beijerinckii TaxID=170623 RepID=A0A1H9R394_9GAMM|nr:MFS transporter [Azotobacter beijerinckii]SEJ46915.1 Sugar phosphate permease [Azotobacter beijerinckii]SER67196.1 Sugar phosphate permease [Azotobacter beijerinckii]